MESILYCVACLVTDVNMCSLEKYWKKHYAELYSLFEGILEHTERQHMCAECTKHLYNYIEFKAKCRRANEVLSQFEIGRKQVTEYILQNVDRKINNLESKLQCTPVYSFDILAKDTNVEEHTGFNDDDDKIKFEVEVKVENDPVFDNAIENLLSEDQNNINDVPFNDYNSSSDEVLSAIVTKRKPKRKIDPPLKKTRRKKPKQDIIMDDEQNALKENKIKKRKNSLECEFLDNYVLITNLSPEEARQEMLLRKESNCNKSFEFNCEMCYKGFDSKITFNNHMEKHSIAAGEYVCEFCKIRFTAKRHLRRHLLVCHERKFSCMLCPYVCYGKNQAKAHVNRHSGKKFACEFCGEMFNKKHNMMKHTRAKHLDFADERVCEFCGNVFVSPMGLSLHVKLSHRQEKNSKDGPECIDCGVHFSSEEAWKLHLVTSSKHKVSNGCKRCGATFDTLNELRVHAQTHERRRGKGIKLPVACPVCKKMYNKLREYKSHMMAEHPQSEETKRLHEDDQIRPFVCEVCGKAFKSPFYLIYHNRTHTDERPYACGACGKAFRMPGQLAVHANVHTKQRTYKCQMCTSAFAHRSALDKHMKAHLGIRPHKCTSCDKAFLHPCELKQHLKYTHEKVPWPKRQKKTKKENSE